MNQKMVEEFKKVDKKGLHIPSINKKLTKSEQEVLDLITIKFLNLKQIQIVRKCSRQAVYKIIKSLKRKGVLNIGLQEVNKSEGSCQPKTNQVRLHGQEFNIGILWQDQIYQKLLKKSNVVYLEGHTIKLYRNVVELYAGEGTSFYGEDESRADKKSMEYWSRFFVRLEHEFKIIIFKERSRNIKEVNHHYERGNSEICENSLEETGKEIRVFAKEDGKLAFITDESFGGKNDETVHPITAKSDRKAIDKQVNDWRLNNPPTNSELARNQLETAQGLKIISETMNYAIKDLPIVLNSLKEQINSHLLLIKEYRKENILWRRETIKNIKNELKYGKQLKINDFDESKNKM